MAQKEYRVTFGLLVVLALTALLFFPATVIYGSLFHGKKKSPPPKQGEGPLASRDEGGEGYVEPKGPLPLLPKQSSFRKELLWLMYPDMPAPRQPPRLRWDFSKRKSYRYRYAHKIRGRHRLSALEHEATRFLNIDGTLVLQSRGGGTADLRLRDLRFNAGFKLEPGTPEADLVNLRKSWPALTITGIKEDGVWPPGESGEEVLLRTLFPLPPKPLKLGESVSVPGRVPFRLGGRLAFASGPVTITLSRYVAIGKRVCARLDTKLDLSTIQPPPGLPGSYRCGLRGQSVFWFDIRERAFVLGKAAVVLSLHADLPIPEAQRERASRSAAGPLPTTLRQVTDDDHFIVLERLPEKDSKAPVEKKPVPPPAP